MLGLVNEHGPCLVNNDTSTVRLNPQSWNQNSNMYALHPLQTLRIPHLPSHPRLYIDQPIGAGFSYGSTTTKSSMEAAEALWKVSCLSLTLLVTNANGHLSTFSSFKSSSPIPSSVNTRRGNSDSGQSPMVVIMVPRWLRERASHSIIPSFYILPYYPIADSSSIKTPLSPREHSLVFRSTSKSWASATVSLCVLSHPTSDFVASSPFIVS